MQAYKLVNEGHIKLTLNGNETEYLSTLYNVCLVENGKEIQPNGYVSVYIPLPKSYEGKNIKIYRETNSGGWEPIDTIV